MSALDDRRWAAREAGLDEVGHTQDLDVAHAVEAAIETATRVRITPELLRSMNPAVGDRETRLRTALEAAGFEVES